MGNWRFIEISGTLPEGVDANEIISFLNNHDEIDYFQVTSQAVHGLDYWIPEDSSTIRVCSAIGKCSSGVDFITNEMTIFSTRFPSVNLVIHIGKNYENSECAFTILVGDSKCTILPPQQQFVGWRHNSSSSDYKGTPELKTFKIDINNGVGGSIDDYIIVASNIERIYKHFLDLFQVASNGNYENDFEGIWNLEESELKRDIGKGTNPNTPKNVIDRIICDLLCWYCRKFNKSVQKLNINDIIEAFNRYFVDWCDGIYIRELTSSHIYS